MTQNRNQFKITVLKLGASGEKKAFGLVSEGFQDNNFDYLLGVPATLPRKTLKNSEEAGSTTITSLFLLKLAL